MRINVDKPFDYLVLLLNKKNELQYCGDLVDLDIAQSFTKLLHDKPIVFLKSNYKNRTNFSDFKQKLAFLAKGLIKHFDELSHVYKPFIEFKYTHNSEMLENKEKNSDYYNFILKLKLKDVSKSIMDKPDVVFFTKYFKNEFGGTLTLEFIDTVSINDSPKCSFCPTMLNTIIPHFYDQEANTYMCLKCEATKNVPENSIFHPTNLIYLSYENPSIVREMIKKNYDENKPSLNYLEGFQDSNYAECSICRTPMNSQKIIWISLIHLYDNKNPSLPVLLCDSYCFPILSRRESAKDLSLDEKQVNNMKMNCIDFRNLAYKKVIMPDTSMF